MMVWLLPAVLLVIALGASRYGADSRDGQDWRKPPSGQLADAPPRRLHTPARDLAAAVTATARFGRGAASRIGGRYRAQVRLWDRFLLLQQPWRDESLRWSRDRDGWHLEGRVLPRTPRIPPPGERRPVSCD